MTGARRNRCDGRGHAPAHAAVPPRRPIRHLPPSVLQLGAGDSLEYEVPQGGEPEPQGGSPPAAGLAGRVGPREIGLEIRVEEKGEVGGGGPAPARSAPEARMRPS